MPSPLTIRSEVRLGDDGKARLSKVAHAQIAAALPLYAGREVEITIRPPKRSTAANAYYWGVVVREAQRVLVEAGYALTSDDVHRWLKRRHLPWRHVDTPTGPETREPSTASLDSTEFFGYVEAIRTDEALLALGFHAEAPEPAYRSYKLVEA